jgi:20S proteasome subunit alpha 6
VLVSLKKSQNELAGYVEKIFDIDDHMGIAISGLTADARNLCKYMRTECMNYWYVHESKHPVSRLVEKIGESKSFTLQIES